MLYFSLPANLAVEDKLSLPIFVVRVLGIKVDKELRYIGIAQKEYTKKTAKIII